MNYGQSAMLRQTVETITYSSVSGEQACFTRLKYAIPKASASLQIAVIASHDRNPHESRIIHSYVTSLQELCPDTALTVDVFYLQHNVRVLNDYVGWYLRCHQEHYALLVSVGVMPTLGIYELRKTWNVALGQMFIGVSSVKELGIISHQKNYGIAGIETVITPPTDSLMLLKDLRPDVKRAVLPYDAVRKSNGEALVHDMIASCKEHDIEVTPLPLTRKSDVAGVVTSFLRDHQLLIMNHESPILSAGTQVVASCNRQRVTALSLTQSGVRSGAALGVGGLGSEYGQPAALMSYQLLFENISLAACGIQSLCESSEIRFNNLSFDQQNLTVSPYLLRALNARCIYANDAV